MAFEWLILLRSDDEREADPNIDHHVLQSWGPYIHIVGVDHLIVLHTTRSEVLHSTASERIDGQMKSDVAGKVIL